MKSKKIPTYLKYYLSKTRLDGLVFNKTYLENLSGISFYLDHSIEDKIKINFKASESTQESFPTPESPQDVHVVKGDNEIRIFDNSLYSYNTTQTVNGITLTNNDNKSIDLSGTNTGARFNFGVTNIPIENIDRTKTYKFISNMPTNKFSLSVAEYNGTTWVRTLGSLGSGATKIEITPSNDTSITKIGIALFIDANATLDISNLKFAFVEKLQNYPLSLGALEMCNINNNADAFFKNVPECEYYDSTLEEGKWYKYARIGKVILDGSEVWKYTNGVFYINGFLRFVKGQPVLSNYFKYGGSATNTTTAYQNGNNTISFNVDDGSSIYIRNDSITNINDFNDWLSTHNTEVYYVLLTPTKTLLSNTLQEQLDNIHNNAHTYDKITNINQLNDDRPFILDISYYRKVK